MDFIFKDDSLIWRNLSPDESSKCDSFAPWNPHQGSALDPLGGSKRPPNPLLHWNDLRSFIRCLRQRSAHLFYGQLCANVKISSGSAPVQRWCWRKQRMRSWSLVIRTSAVYWRWWQQQFHMFFHLSVKKEHRMLFVESSKHGWFRTKVWVFKDWSLSGSNLFVVTHCGC